MALRTGNHHHRHHHGGWNSSTITTITSTSTITITIISTSTSTSSLAIISANHVVIHVALVNHHAKVFTAIITPTLASVGIHVRGIR